MLLYWCYIHVVEHRTQLTAKTSATELAHPLILMYAPCVRSNMHASSALGTPPVYAQIHREAWATKPQQKQQSPLLYERGRRPDVLRLLRSG